MNCKDCVNEMTAYLDGELPSREAGHVRSHIEGCLPCAEEFHGLSEAAQLVHAHHKKLEPKPGSWGRVQARIARSESGWGLGFLREIFARRWQPAMAVAAVVISVAFGLWGYYHHMETERTLRLYMSDYMRMRDAEELRFRNTGNPAARSRIVLTEADRLDNPFLFVRESKDDNPFRQHADEPRTQ